MAEKLTPEQIDESYKLGLEAYEDIRTVAEAIDELENRSLPNRRINKNTGGTLIRGFKKMMEGIGIENSITGDTLRVYMQNIYDDSNYGEEQVETCLNAVESFFNEYPHYKDDNRCEVHDDFSRAIGKTLIYNIQIDDEQDELSEEKAERRKKVPHGEIVASYRLSKLVHDAPESEKKNVKKEAVKELANELLKYGRPNYEKAKDLAHGYMHDFEKIMRGEVYKYGLSKPHLKYHLEKIWKDYGERQVKTCLVAIEAHIDYRQELSYKKGKKTTAAKNLRRLHNKFSDDLKMELIYATEEPHEKIKFSEQLAVGKLLKESWLIENANEYKVHFAKKNRYGHPLDLCSKDPEEWQRWQEYRPEKDTFNRKFIFSLMQYYDEPNTWLFGGVFEVLGEKNSRYTVELTDQLAQYIGRLKIEYNYVGRNVRVNFENYYNSVFVKEILEKPLFIVAKKINTTTIRDSKPSESEDDMESTNKDYTIEDILEDGCFVGREELGKYLKRFKDKKNFILQGPPGTGKTWLAKRLGYALIGSKEKKEQVRSAQFHPSTSYEDFVMGYRPSSKGLILDPGTFLKFIDKAKKEPSEKFVMVIEEINRGNPVQIFGEMLTLLEADKRNSDEALWLCYQQEEESENPNAIDCYVYGKNEPVYIPENVYVLGTMNLTDKSLGVLDFAFRRRFAFANLKPELNDVWKKHMIEMTGDEAIVIRIQENVGKLNEKIEADPELGKQYCIGHSYFTLNAEVSDVREWFREVVYAEIEPLLEEYWLEAPATIKDDEEDSDKKPKTKVEEAIEELLKGFEADERS